MWRSSFAWLVSLLSRGEYLRQSPRLVTCKALAFQAPISRVFNQKPISHSGPTYKNATLAHVNARPASVKRTMSTRCVAVRQGQSEIEFKAPPSFKTLEGAPSVKYQQPRHATNQCVDHLGKNTCAKNTKAPTVRLHESTLSRHILRFFRSSDLCSSIFRLLRLAETVSKSDLKSGVT